MKLIDSIVTQAAGIAAIRRDLHAHPELAYEEVRTADVVAARLTEWGIPIHRGLGTTGVVGIVKNGTSDRAVGLRADMDALPIHELNTFDHASQHQGKMHACGHDGHAAMLLGAAAVLKRRESEIKGTIRLIWQPAEEGGAGGKRMVEEGVLSMEPKPQAAFGFHQWPFLPLGSIGGRPGPMLAATELFDIVVSGVGGHAAMCATSVT